MKLLALSLAVLSIVTTAALYASYSSLVLLEPATMNEEWAQASLVEHDEAAAVAEYRWVFALGSCRDHDEQGASAASSASFESSELPIAVERIGSRLWSISADYRPDRHTIEVLGVADLTVPQRHWCEFELPRSNGIADEAEAELGDHGAVAAEIIEGTRFPTQVLLRDVAGQAILIVCEIPHAWRDAFDECRRGATDEHSRVIDVSMSIVDLSDRDAQPQQLMGFALHGPRVPEEQRADRAHACVLVSSGMASYRGVGTIPLASLLAEWIAYHTSVLDVAHVTVYTLFDAKDESNADVSWALERMQRSGLVSVIDWRPVAQGTPARNQAQVAQLNHCLMANRPYARYLLTLDMDEFLALNCSMAARYQPTMPGTNDNDNDNDDEVCTASRWARINHMAERSAAACFPRYRFHIVPGVELSWPVRNVSHVSPIELWTQRLSEREEFVEHRLEEGDVRNSLRFRKCLLHTERTQWSNVHDTVAEHEWSPWEDVLESSGAIRLYRRLKAVPLVQDTFMHRFSLLILDALQHQLLQQSLEEQRGEAAVQV